MLAAKTGSKDVALKMAGRFMLMLCMDSARVAEAWDAWDARIGKRDELLDVLTKNPSLLACPVKGEYGIEEAPVGVTKFVAGAIDFFRKESNNNRIQRSRLQISSMLNSLPCHSHPR